jgi:hypothetical protein
MTHCLLIHQAAPWNAQDAPRLPPDVVFFGVRKKLVLAMSCVTLTCFLAESRAKSKDRSSKIRRTKSRKSSCRVESGTSGDEGLETEGDSLHAESQGMSPSLTFILLFLAHFT